MKNIARALKHQKLRKRFPKGLKMRVVQTGLFRYTLRATDFRTGLTENWRTTESAVAIAIVTQMMWDIAEELREAGVFVDIDPGPDGKKVAYGNL